jgi:selenocysteine lyase/cysteine desulfurase
MYAHRGCAVFYVPHRNRHLQRSSLPTSFFYTPNPTAEKNTWLQQWNSPGTEDMASRLSVGAAIEFREMLGGEARIMNYNHDLAVRGGKAAARVLGTSVMDTPDNALTASMVNVRLPIVQSRLPSSVEALNVWAAKADRWFFDRLYNDFKTFTPVFIHDGKPWARFSAQAWLEIDDFEYGARALLELCKRINEGQVTELNVSA